MQQNLMLSGVLQKSGLSEDGQYIKYRMHAINYIMIHNIMHTTTRYDVICKGIATADFRCICMTWHNTPTCTIATYCDNCVYHCVQVCAALPPWWYLFGHSQELRGHKPTWRPQHLKSSRSAVLTRHTPGCPDMFGHVWMSMGLPLFGTKSLDLESEDFLVAKDLSPILDRIDDYDLVSYTTSGQSCQKGTFSSLSAWLSLIL